MDKSLYICVLCNRQCDESNIKQYKFKSICVKCIADVKNIPFLPKTIKKPYFI